MNSFLSRLQTAWDTSDSLLCVGLDPDPERLPEPFTRLAERDLPAAMEGFCQAIIDMTADLVCAFKPQIAYFAAAGAEAALARVIAYARKRAPGVPILLDAKRGDIGATARMYAREAFVRFDADAVTINPYLGGESVEPYLDWPERGTIILCRTSNPGAGELQDWPEHDPLYQRVARIAARDWNPRDNLMLVAGATRPEQLAEIRRIVPGVPLLVPGLGAQGGDMEAALMAGLDEQGRGLVVNSSRAVLYADSGQDFDQAARREAMRTRDAMRRIVAQRSKSAQTGQ